MDNRVTPQMLAEFDQNLAEITEKIHVFITVYKAARREFSTPEAITGLANTLNIRCENQDAACQYLAVAIHHLATRDT